MEFRKLGQRNIVLCTRHRPFTYNAVEWYRGGPDRVLKVDTVKKEAQFGVFFTPPHTSGKAVEDFFLISVQADKGSLQVK